MEYKTVDTTYLHEWEQNPRNIQEDDFARLLNQITRLGQYKPLLAMPDGTVLGGNMRLKALRSLGQEKAWISEIDFVERDGKWYAVVNGEERVEPFESRLQGMTEYALSDNDRAGYYQSDDLSNLLGQVEIDLTAYAVDFYEPLNIEEAIEQQEEQEKKKNFLVTVECQTDEEQARVHSFLKDNGLKVKPLK